MTTLLSLIFLALIEEYCKHNNHKTLRNTISVIRRIIRHLDGGLSDSFLDIIFQVVKGLK